MGTTVLLMPHSPLHIALSKVGDRWTLLVIEALLDGASRFGDLQEQVTGIAPNTLSSRLKALEADGLVVANAYSERPPRYEYTLTAAGKELAGAISLLTAWGSRQSDEGIHLHWEIYVDDVYLGAGLREADIVRVYAALFS